MAKLIEVEASGSPVRFLVRLPGESVVAVGVLDTAIEKLEVSLTELFKSVAAIATDFHTSISCSPVTEAELELGLQFTAKGSVYVMESEAQGAIKVRLTFRRGGSAPIS